MNLKEFAEKLTGREYGYPQFTKEEIAEAKENGIVIVSGASDDLMELEGAMQNEFYVFNGRKVYIRPCEMSVLAKWCEDKDEQGRVISWTYETSVPHETFDIVEGGEIYCRGIVFSIDQDKKKSPGIPAGQQEASQICS